MKTRPFILDGPNMIWKETRMHTKDRLAKALRDAGLPEALAQQAEEGKFDDFLSDSATPQMDLADQLRKFATPEANAIIDQLYEGVYDSTKEESDQWAASPEGQEIYRRLINNE